VRKQLDYGHDLASVAGGGAWQKPEPDGHLAKQKASSLDSSQSSCPNEKPDHQVHEERQKTVATRMIFPGIPEPGSGSEVKFGIYEQGPMPPTRWLP